MTVRLAMCAAGWVLATAVTAVAEGDLARRAPPQRPDDLVEVSAAALDAAVADVAASVAAAPVAVPEPMAQPKEAPRDPSRGAVTNLPVPRFVTLKTDEGNARRGPGLTHKIDWVFTRVGMPLRVTGEYENWRRVEDAEGAGGWVHFSLLSGARSALVMQPIAEFHEVAVDGARVVFQAEAGVVGRVLECAAEWCRMSVDGGRGWVRKAAIWGVAPDEVIE